MNRVGDIMQDLLHFDNVSYYYRDVGHNINILTDVTYNFVRGKMYAVLGPSGSGKSTFLSLAGGLDTPKQGRIVYEGKDIMTIGLSKYRKLHRALVFQSYNLIPYLTALQNVTLAMDIVKTKHSDKKNKAINVLKQVGLSEAEVRRNVLKLSGGQQQRVAIARALACEVDLILADEPTGNLDQTTAQDIIDIFRSLAHNNQKCVILVTHSQAVADAADEVLMLQHGQFVEHE